MLIIQNIQRFNTVCGEQRLIQPPSAFARSDCPLQPEYETFLFTSNTILAQNHEPIINQIPIA